MSGGEKVDAKAKAIAAFKKELVLVGVVGVAAVAVLLVGGSGALNVLRWVVAALIVVLVVAARVLRRRRARHDDGGPPTLGG